VRDEFSTVMVNAVTYRAEVEEQRVFQVVAEEQDFLDVVVEFLAGSTVINVTLVHFVEVIQFQLVLQVFHEVP
jgi:hypothetical protein